MNPHCRIGRVRMKNGGAEVRVFERPQMNRLGPEILRHADMLARDVGYNDLVGYWIVGWTAEGKTSTCWRCLVGEPQPAACRMPSLIEEVARRDFVTEPSVRHVIDREYVPPKPRGPAA